MAVTLMNVTCVERLYPVTRTRIQHDGIVAHLKCPCGVLGSAPPDLRIVSGNVPERPVPCCRGIGRGIRKLHRKRGSARRGVDRERGNGRDDRGGYVDERHLFREIIHGTRTRIQHDGIVALRQMSVRGFGQLLHHTSVLFPVTFLNDQFHAVGVLEEVSVNFTVSGAVPDVVLTVNEATGGIAGAVTLMNVTCFERLYTVPRTRIQHDGIVAHLKCPCGVLGSCSTIPPYCFR